MTCGCGDSTFKVPPGSGEKDDSPSVVTETDDSKPEIVLENTSNQDLKAQRAKAYEDVPDGELIVHRTMAGDLQADGWCIANPTRGNFTVELPGKYLDQMIKSLGKEGYPGGVMHVVIAFTDDGVEFSVLQTELFGERPDGDVVANTTQSLKDKGAEVRELDVMLSGHPARKLVVTHPLRQAEMVFLQGEQSDYLLGVQFNPMIDRDLGADIDRFYQSFEVAETHNNSN